MRYSFLSIPLIFGLVVGLLFCGSSCHSTAYVASDVSVSSADSLLQKVDYQFIKKIDVQGKIIALDALQNIYVVSQNNELIQFSSEGKELYRYSNYELGDMTHIDVSNPFNILVFYGAYQTIEILDRSLTRTSSFDMFQADVTNVQAVSLSNDQEVWVYDEMNFKLKKLNNTGKVVLESGDVSQVIPKAFSPTYLMESGGLVYVSVADAPILIFDVLGNYQKKTNFKLAHPRFQLLNDKFLYRKNNTFHIRDTKVIGMNESKFPLPNTPRPVLDAQAQKNQMLVLGKEALYMYRFLLK